MLDGPAGLPKLLLIATLVAIVGASGGCKSSEATLDLDALRMLPIPGGTFLMGDFVDYEDSDATPVHPVTVDDFLLSATETTFAQYDRWATATNRDLPDDEGYGRGGRAVVNVSWHDALAFCGTYGYRLPSEAEWEYAARSGGKALRWSGTNDPDSALAFVRFDDNGEMAATYVGTKQPNDLGLFDMSGNVFEWIGAFYEFYPTDPDSTVMKDVSVPGIRIVRGGSVRNPLAIAQTWWRSGTLSDATSEMIGFRCAADR